MFQKKELFCKECIWAEYHHAEAILSRGYICKLNPFKPVIMGLAGKHSMRKQNKEEQYRKKDS